MTAPTSPIFQPSHDIDVVRPTTSHQTKQLQQLNTALLPILYPAHFYTSILTDPSTNNLTRVALVLHHHHPNPSSNPAAEGVVIGGIRCRVETSPSEHTQQQHGRKKLYIQTLAVQPAYRRLGVATRLLQEVITAVQADEEVVQVAAHVWVENEDALEWYRHRGFEVDTQVVEGYYRRLRPGGARFVWRDLR